MSSCTRYTKAEQPCKNARVIWSRRAELPDPCSCMKHLSPAEYAAYQEIQRAYEAESPLVWDGRLPELLESDPACWAWPIESNHAARAREASEADDVEDSEEIAEALLREWQDERCAVCGDRGHLVKDHDHHTGMVRGLLCQPCNRWEARRGGVFQRYRDTPPASILQVRLRYWNPISSTYAEPVPDHDRWEDNPMRNVGL